METRTRGLLIYYSIILFFTLLILSILAPPFLIFSGFEGAGAALYNLHSYDHQWIYRSQCVFQDAAGNLLLEDCIIQGREQEAKISTLYTLGGGPAYNGVFEKYSQSQIGRNKAEKVERNGMTGYKFANDARDYAIYVPWTAAMLAYPLFLARRMAKFPHAAWLALFLIPLGIDGGSQALAGIFSNPDYYWLSPFGLQESTILIRLITGGIAGIGAGVFAAATFYPGSKNNPEGGAK